MDFEPFLDRELDGLIRYARVLTGDRQTAHDTLADTLIRANARWRRIGAMEFPGAYVRRMITSTYLSERRRWHPRMVHPVDPRDLPETLTADAHLAVADRSQLHSLLSALPRRQRAAIVLRFYLDLSDADIAAELGCSTGAVRTYISRGLAAVRISARTPVKEES